MTSFGDQLREEYRVNVEDEHSKLTRVVALQVLEGVVMLSPVDTGRLRNNWQVGVATPPEGVLAADGGGAGAPPSGAQVAQAMDALGRLEPFGKAFVANNLEYASYQEDGTPNMAPQPMVRPTIARVEAQFR